MLFYYEYQNQYDFEHIVLILIGGICLLDIFVIDLPP